MSFKKITLGIAAVGVLFSLTACSDKSAASSFKLGFEAMENGDYEAAEEYYLEAMNAGFDKNDVDELYDIVSNFNNAEECIKNGDYKSAKEYFEGIPRLYKSYEIEDDVEDLEEIIEEYEESLSTYKKAYNYYKSGLYEDAKRAASEVDTEYLTDVQKQNVDTIINAEIKSSETKTDNDAQTPASDNAVNYLMNEYAWSMVDAINAGDFSIVSHTLYPGSSLYTSQKDLVNKLYRQNITETMDSLTVTDITWTSDDSCTISTTEAVYVNNANGSSEYKTYKWKYTAKMYNGSLKLTSIDKN